MYRDPENPIPGPIVIMDLPLQEAVAGGLAVTYSSILPSDNCKRRTYFQVKNNKGEKGWCSKNARAGEYVQIDPGRVVLFKKIETTGRNNDWVETYDLLYSEDGFNWKAFQGTFIANEDLKTPKVNLLDPPLKARLIRIVVRSFHIRPSMKFEAYFTEYLYLYIYIYIVGIK